MLSGVALSWYIVSADDADVYNIQVINVFPSKVSAPGWNNAETLVQQNVSEVALYQDFNQINSAWFNLEEVPIEQIIKNRNEEKINDASSLTPLPSQQVIDDSKVPTIDKVDETTTTQEVETQTNSDVETADTDIEYEAEVNVNNEEFPTTTSFKKAKGGLNWVLSSVTKWLPFMNESTTTPVAQDESVDLVDDDAGDSTLVAEPTLEESVIPSTSNSGEETVTATTSVPNEIIPATNTPPIITATPAATTTELPSGTLKAVDNPDSVVVPSVSDPCGEMCAEYTIQLSDFGLPIFNDKFSVHGAQLKVSFAAKLKKTRDAAQLFKLRYSFDNGASWSEAGKITITEEVTNGTNGGYFLFALPEISDSDTLNNLMIELVYDDDPRALDGLFVESAWLELFALESPDVTEDNLTLLTDNGYDDQILKGDTLKLPDGTNIDFTFTDDNTNETLIIKSDKVNYPGLSKSTLYFNVTNISKSEDTFKLQTYFPDGIGQVTNIEEWNSNKPKDVVVPEYKPFVYHCEAGWELTNNPVNSNLEDISKLLAPSSDNTTTIEPAVIPESEQNNFDNGNSEPDTSDQVDISKDTPEETSQPGPVNDVETPTEDLESGPDTNDETLKSVDNEAPLLQSTIQNNLSTATSSSETDDESDEVLATTYVCRNTNIVRECDEIDGDNTACRINDVKVREHKLVQYVDGWEPETVVEGTPEDKRSLFKKAKDWLGFGPDIKPKPDTFEVRAHTPNEYTIAPGETKYFKMEISFPPLTTGEFWIEAIGDDEYGLLDPFWASQWNYRLPITIDNTSGTSNLTEQQVFLELNSSLTNFWANVNDDGSDIRFVQETTTGTEDAWYGTGWSDRIPITIQSSQVDSDQTDFPVYVNLADLGTDFFNTVKSDGGDIRITESDGTTEVPYELVSINTGADTGELHFKGDVSSSVDTTFYLYFGNSDAVGYAETDTYGAQNVWNSEFIAVYHLEEAAAGRGTAGLYQDSTSNEYDADDQLNSSGKTGLLGQGQEIDAQGDASEYMLLPSDIVNGETELTFMYWMNSSEAGNQALINGGANNEYLLYNTGGGTTLQFFPGATISINDLSIAPNWRHVLISRDTVGNEWKAFIDGVEDDNSPSSQSLSTLSIPDNCLVLGLEQDVSCLSSGDTSQHLNATIDEMRFLNVVPGDDWITATYRNQSTTTDFYATSTRESFTNTVFSELDYWLQHFSTSTDEADVWVQVDSLPAGASTTIYMYYGNAAATPASDEFAPFTYSTTTPIYYAVEGLTGGTISVYSYVDNNLVSIDGGTPVPLDSGEPTTFSSYSSTSVISSLGPIAATIDSAGGDILAPISFATTTFAVPTTRNTSSYYIHSPFASSTINTYLGNSGTPSQTFSVATGTTGRSTTDGSGSNGVVITSTQPVLVYHMETGSRDSFVSYPPTTRDIFGIYTGSAYISTVTDNPNPTVYCSGGSSATVSGVTRGEQQSIGTCTSTGQGAGGAARLTNALYPITAIQQADGDGNESSAFWARHEMGTQYYIPTDSAYVAIACSPRFGTTTLEVQQNDGTFVEGATCTPGANTPGKVYFDNGQGGSALAFIAGYKVVSTNGVPFYAIYEDDEEDNDETNMLGGVQGRKYANRFFGYSFGAQEVTIDAEYEQLSFGWYENSTNQTPTSTWPLGEGSFATEGIAITGQGAVNDGDVMRLRMNLQANVATGSASSTAFKLQYVEADTGQCSVATAWSDVGEIGSTTAAFNGYNNGSLIDGTILSSTTLASSTVSETYEEENLSEFLQNTINPGEVGEWDWTITSNNASVNSNYCFRMVRSTGIELVTYTSYPELETAGPPLAPTLISFFNNERTASSSPVVLDFAATDIAGDDIRYQIQVDDDVAFGSPVIDKNSQTSLSQFENVNTPSDKTPFDSGARIRFTGTGSLTASTTYWWRVRGLDPSGSNTWGDWSTAYSFTTDGSVTVSEWHQTTGDQFSTNALTSLSTSTGAVSVSGSSGVMTSTAIDFDDATVGNAWGSVSWGDTETSGTILYQIEYLNGSSWSLIPDSAIANNSVGNGTSPINLLDLDTDTYNQIRLVANFTGTSLSIQDWTVVWGQRVETPTLGDPFDNEKIATTTPALDFTTTDPQGDLLEYEISWGTDYTFVSSTTRNSSTSPGFSSGNPYASGASVTYTIQSGEALTNGQTYWWRVRAKDPYGGDAWSPWSAPDAFTVDTSVSVSTWFQTTREQFQQGTLNGLTASTSGSVTISNEVGEYGKVILDAGTWTEISTQVSYNDPVVVASLRYSMTGDAQRSVRVRNKTADSFEMIVDDPFGTLTGTTTVDYLVMETGVWTLQDGAGGTQVIAGTYANVSDVQGGGGYAASGYGADVTFSPPFSVPPAVIATVSTENDSSWVIAHLNDGNTRNNPPTASAMGLYLGRSNETAVHSPEDIDYIAFEPGHGTNNGAEFDADFGTDSHDEAPPTAEAFTSAFSPSAPEVVIVMQGAEQGGNGAWASLYAATPPTTSNYYPVVDESGDRNHTTEPILTLAFENASGVLLRDSTVGGDLTGEIYSEPILFSDGAGPKFEQLLWNDTEPGTSTITYRLQYLTSTSSWAYIPDAALPNNSIGTTTSPIDLTGLNVSTYNTLRIVGSFSCASGNCPSLQDWTIEWSEGVLMSGTLKQYDRSTNVTSGTVRAAVNGSLLGNTGTVSAGVWSISNVTAFAGDVVTVWVDGAAEANEAVAVFVYDGTGDITGVQMFEQHLSLSSDENGTTTNALLGAYDNSVSGDEDIFFDVDGSNDLSVCAISGCSEASLYIGSGDVYIPDVTSSGNVTTHDFINSGRVELDANTVRVSGSWKNNATFLPETSTIIFTATSTSETVDDADNILDFQNLTFGETSGTATWQTYDPVDVNGALNVTYGTLNRASSTITVAGNLTTGANGFWSGVSTTTFDGSGTSFWSDSNTVKQNVGRVVVDGGAKTITLSSSVYASSTTIGANDTLNAGGANTLFLAGNFTNDNVFSAQTGTIQIVGTSTNAIIKTNGSSLYNVTASTTGSGSISFSESSVSMLGNLTIATGTVTLATATTTIGGSFLNTGGTFAHNNGAVRFTGSGSKSVTLGGTTFLNHLYNVTFAGSGTYTFADINATTSNILRITSGNVVLPSGQLSVARNFITSGSGSFSHNNGEVVLLIEGNDTVTTNGSSFNNLRIRQGSGGSGSWYGSQWTSRVPITIRSSVIDGDLSNFPVYVDLSDLPSAFFSGINTGGGDIRITQSDGITEVPREIVSASTTAETGELYFKASSVSSTTDTIFYIYYGNATATDYAVTATYGAQNVWNNGYVLVSHMNDETTSTIVNSANGSLDGTKLSANNPPQTNLGQIYEAQNFAGTEHIAYGNVGSGAANITISAWINPSNLTGSGDTNTYGYSIFSAHSAGAYTWLTVGGSGGGGSTDEVRFCAFSSSVTCNVANGSNINTGEWHYVSATAIDGGAAAVRVDGNNVLSFTSDGGGTWNSGSTIGDLRPNRDIEFEGILDEIQISNVVRSTAWQDATYRNQGTTTDFYAVGSPQQDSVRTMADINTTVTGNMTVESGQVILPTGVLSIGGSFDNNDGFDANDGTVLFNSTSSSETIAPGSSSFYNLSFNSVSGDWTIIENATSTNNVTLTNAGTLTLNSGLSLYVGGEFTSAVGGASTTWTGSNIILGSGTDYVINTKTAPSDVYATLTVTGDGDVSLWNSSATIYNMLSTASLYSQDHTGVDGDLYIFGNYVRTSGTEHWSYLTDFDGVSLATTTPRQVDVRIQNGATVIASSSGLSIVGSSTASTTIDAQSGSFTLRTNTASVTAQYFEVTGTNASGFQLTSSSTVNTFNNAYFRIPAASSAVTVDASTIDTTPAKQFFDTDFVTAGGNVNVTLSGSPTSYWWFRDGAGDRYGEAFDNADGNPGSIRWDDSSYSIVVSGTVYADDGNSTLGGPTCDGVTNSVRIVVDGGVYSSSTPCSGVDGSYSFGAVNYVGDPSIIVYLDTNGGTTGSVITKTPTANITNLDIYANRVMTRHEDLAPLTIADMAVYDESDDTDIRFVAATGTTDTLTVRADNELYIFASTTFAPGGPVTLTSGGTGNVYDGTLHLGATSTFTGVGTTTYNVGGSIIVEPAAKLTTASSTFVMTATTTGKTITASSTLAFNTLQFTGVGGGWNLNTNITATSGINVATGTLTGTANVTVTNGSFYGDGLVSFGAGTVAIYRSNTYGGVQSWTVNNLTLGNGTVVGTTTPGGTATNTVSGVLTINAAHFLDANNSAWNLTGSGSVFVENGTFLEDTSTVRYGGVLGNTVRNTQYYNLTVEASGGTPTFTAAATGLPVLNNLRVGGTAPTTFTLDTNDPVGSIGGDVYIASNGTLVGSNSATLTVGGAWDNDGTFTNSGGTVTFNSTDAFTIAAGASSFGVVNISGAGAATVIENATSTGAWTLGTTSNFTLNSGNRLAVGGLFTNGAGGAATTWTGSTLHLFGAGQFTINASTTLDQYENLSAAAGTHIRMWNSSATSYLTASGGSVYSMDHLNVTGELYIFGDYIKSSGTDYWSYATDFDGTTLGSGRAVDVYVENGGSFTYSGGSLQMIGSTTASTTVQVQGGSGTYSADITGGGINAQYYILQDLDNDGLTFSGAPTVTTLSNGEFIIGNTGATAMTVAGSVINANPAKNFINNRFATSTGVTAATNVTTSGSTVSSWRFTNHTGDVDGEDFDADNGNPGYIVWDDSLAVITISGNVYENNTSSVSSVCDDVTTNIVLAVAGVVVPAASSTCSSATGAYSISGVSFSPNDTLTLFINSNGGDQGVTVSIDPISSVGDMDIYEDHVILRHESTDPILIADMAVYDSVNDSDIPFTAVDAGSDTLTLNTNTKLIVWANKEFEPQGNITTGGGISDALDGTVELRDNAILTLANTENHAIGGNLEMGTGSVFTPAQSTVTFTSAGSGRTIATNETGFYNLILNGSGTFTSSDTSLRVANDMTLTAGTLTLPNATTTITGSLSVTGGNFVANGGLIVFDSTTAETVVANNSDFNRLLFNGTGSWSMNDTNATATGAITIQKGAVTLPSGVLSVGGSFRNTGGSVVDNTSLLVISTSTSATLLASSSDLYGVTFTGGGTFTMEDNSLTLLDDLILNSGSLTLASGTLSIGGSLDATGGTFTHASGTILFNSSDAGETINPGNNNFNNISIASASGGWTMLTNATTTGNFLLTNAASYTQTAGTVLAVQGVFSNSVGGAATTWTDSTLKLLSGSDYSINTKSAGGDTYGTLYIYDGMDIRMWDSSAATTTLASTSISSLYSQDHANTPGYLYIYGNYTIATGTEYWSYATDFDGTALGGGSRAVNVFVVDSASSSITQTAGNLNIIGAATASTSIQALGGTNYSFDINAGTFNARYYQLRGLDVNGLTFSGIPTVSSLSNGDFEVTVDGGSAITLASTTLNANPSKLIDNVRFATTTAISAFNVNLDATTTNAWTFRDHVGNLSGEDYDADGIDACGSIRWDDSACLLVEQTHYRWRHDDGGEGVPTSEWFDTDWGARQRVRIVNADNATYATTTIKIPVTYDADMQADFEDLRFTKSDGVTELDYWIERYTASSDATVWVEVFELPAQGNLDIFMYYSNVTATTTSSSSATFVVVDDFESGLSGSYSGDTSLFTVDSSFAFGGTKGLDTTGFESSRATDGIASFDRTVSQGQIIRYMQYIDTGAGSSDESCAMFGVQSPVTSNINYGVCLEQFGIERMSLVENVESTDNYGSVNILASTTLTYATGWYEVEIDWQTDNTIDVYLYNSGGTLVATTSAADSSHSSGGFGFTYWGQNGGWDSFTSRYRTNTKPTVIFGAEQTDGGASWATALDTAANTFVIGDVARVRFAVENSGLGITGQQFQIEYAAKGAAPACEAVSAASYNSVPVQSSCGSSPVCMVSSTYYSDGDNTTDLLLETNGTFTSGKIKEDPSSITASLDIDQNEYTELEYAVSPTVNATSSAYCLRVTNAGTDLDSYLSVAELGVAFDPTITAWSLNGGADITLSPGTTTVITASGTVTDLNGYTDLAGATSTTFRSGVTETCTEDQNNCYRSAAPQCAYSACAGNSCTLSCTFDVYYFAEATDMAPYSGETWRSFIELSDQSGATTSAFAPSVDLLTINAITLASTTNSINYGSLTPSADTGSYNATTTVENIGNGNIDISIDGTDLTDGGASTIPVSEQKFASTTFDYSACAFCTTLATTSSAIEVDLFKPTSTTTPVVADVYWGIQIPFGTAAAPHQGSNTFYAVTDQCVLRL